MVQTMDIEATLLEEHSKSQCEKIVAYIGNDPTRFAELMKIFFSGEYRLTQRAAWPMSYCVQLYPPLINPYLKKMLGLLKDPGQHNAVARNITRLLQDITIPKRYHGQLMNQCFEFIADPHIPVAIKAFSLTILEKLSVLYPEILPEIKLIIEERWEHETAAFRSRAGKLLD